MARIITLHAATAYNAEGAALEGATLETQNFPAILVWFTPADSYDGVATFQVSPDDGVTWFAVDGRAANAIATPISAVDTPTAAVLYIVPVPSGCFFRVLLDATGEQGTLTVEATPTYYNGL